MGAKWQRIAISIPEGYKPAERVAIAEEILDFIRDRVQNKNLDKNNRKLPGYSKSYMNSLDFKIAGKSKGDVNLTLSGDMLGAMTLLSHANGKLLLGFEKGSPENARADGNIRGTYGNSKPVAAPRDFLGLTQKDLTRILKEFPVDNDQKREANTVASKIARSLADGRAEAEIDD